ncbi:MAG: hypothetical protein CVT47_00340 [Thermoplasmata archaeon HGW-Thermoplasmata-2]|nr:MAG: hypothetical protein CVT47_00340 [Thermoplasmata archaeon HGW-Thermoplasmata-2]
MVTKTDNRLPSLAIAVSVLLICGSLAGCIGKDSATGKQNAPDDLEYVTSLNFTNKYPIYQWLIQPQSGGKFEAEMHYTWASTSDVAVDIWVLSSINDPPSFGQWGVSPGFSRGYLTNQKISVLNYTIIDEPGTRGVSVAENALCRFNGTTFMMLCSSGVNIKGRIEFSEPVSIIRQGPDENGSVYCFKETDFDSTLTVCDPHVGNFILNGSKCVEIKNRLFGAYHMHPGRGECKWGVASPYCNYSNSSFRLPIVDGISPSVFGIIANGGPGKWNFYLEGEIMKTLFLVDTNVSLPWATTTLMEFDK